MLGLLAAALAGSTVFLLWRELVRRREQASVTPAATRILFPFVGKALSTPAFDAALRLARAEGATLVPAYIAIVPLSVQLDTPLKKQAEDALPLLEAIEQRAATQGVSVDSRIEAGRSIRHAFRLLMAHEQFDRVVAAGGTNGDGFSPDDIAWLLDHAPGEILILRPARDPAANVGARPDSSLTPGSRRSQVRGVFGGKPTEVRTLSGLRH
ncbi:MAG TPA: universal stress protein [Solirubrobacterales bacterium]|nr:universal stress protein [Solirubrobacterales bacterium]